MTGCLAGSHKVETFSGGKNYLRRGFLIIFDFLARAFPAVVAPLPTSRLRDNVVEVGGGRNFPLARLIASRQSYPSPARKRRQLQLKLPGFHNRLQSLKLAGSRFNRLRVQDKGPSEESRFELFVSFARLRCDFGKLAFSAQIVEQRIRFEIGIAEETAFNTALQHSP